MAEVLMIGFWVALILGACLLVWAREVEHSPSLNGCGSCSAVVEPGEDCPNYGHGETHA